jgi:predicted nucleic acid-binding protein
VKTRSVVCDSSVAVAWLKREPVPDWANLLFESAEQGATAVLVPTLFWLEVGNALGHRSDPTALQAMEGTLRLEATGFESVEMDRPLRLRAQELARSLALTTYDGMYLALATALGAELATLDTDLGQAASVLGCRHGQAGGTGVAEARVYGTQPPVDQVSLAALGACLAELRTASAG